MGLGYAQRPVPLSVIRGMPGARRRHPVTGRVPLVVHPPRGRRWVKVHGRHQARAERLWEEFIDDHTLVGLKILFLGGMIILAAALERVV